jgi:lipopolysaccharide/colanic/teichoic acid biosynthesis glycosyltransferase
MNLNYDYNKFARLLRIGKLSRLTKFAQVEAWVNTIDIFQIHKNKKVRPSANKINLIKNINDLLITLLLLVIVSHIMACFWIFISTISL